MPSNAGLFLSIEVALLLPVEVLVRFLTGDRTEELVDKPILLACNTVILFNVEAVLAIPVEVACRLMVAAKLLVAAEVPLDVPFKATVATKPEGPAEEVPVVVPIRFLLIEALETAVDKPVDVP